MTQPRNHQSDIELWEKQIRTLDFASMVVLYKYEYHEISYRKYCQWRSRIEKLWLRVHYPHGNESVSKAFKENFT